MRSKSAEQARGLFNGGQDGAAGFEGDNDTAYSFCNEQVGHGKPNRPSNHFKKGGAGSDKQVRTDGLRGE